MGCISSKTDINDLHPNLFQVMNVDDAGRVLSHGQIEITETDLILHQRGKQQVKWPLRSLRRYGFEAQVFTFEAGRRCATGPGIYAFHCQRAENLFNLMQSVIQQIRASNNGGEDTISREFTISTPTSVAPNNILTGSLTRGGGISNTVNTLVESQTEPINHLELARNSTSSRSNLRHQQSNSTNSTVSRSGGPQSPSSINLVPSSNSAYYANNIVISSLETESVINNNIRTSKDIIETNGYMTLTSPLSPSTSEQLHLYMNVEPEKEIIEFPTTNTNNCNDKHCYINLGLDEMIKPRPGYISTKIVDNQVNYILLDLDSSATTPLSPVGSIASSCDSQKTNNVQSPTAVVNSISTNTLTSIQQGYAQIDFQKTAALAAAAVDDNNEEQVGGRITRHDSNIQDLIAKQPTTTNTD